MGIFLFLIINPIYTIIEDTGMKAGVR